LSLGLSSPLSSALSLPLNLGEYGPRAGAKLGPNRLTACSTVTCARFLPRRPFYNVI
jgi:hypothetical protein